MNDIEAFVDSIYKDAGGNKNEIKELKTEIKSHLLEAVHDLMSEGRSQQEAIDIAIERFGGEKEMRAIGQMFKSQKVFATRVLYIAFAILIVCLVMSGLIWAVEQRNRDENYYVASSIYEVLGNNSFISIEMDKKIKALVQDTKQVTNIQVYKMSDIKMVTEDGSVSYLINNSEPIYQYIREIRPSSVIDFYYPMKNEWFIHVESKNLATIVGYILTSGIAVYVALFTIWGTINSYHHKRLNIGWIIVFALLNVFGFWIYHFADRNKRTV
jgi:heme/copper-type cytochrome/quinol oxidase subunit 4